MLEDKKQYSSNFNGIFHKQRGKNPKIGIEPQKILSGRKKNLKRKKVISYNQMTKYITML